MGEILNIWREISSYLRYADAKLLTITGIAFSFIINKSSSSPHWLLMSDDKFANIWFYTFLSFIIIININAISPTLRSSINPLNIITNFFYDRNTILNPYYFYDIHYYKSEESWIEALSINLISNEEKSRALLLSAQIFVISRIAVNKFITIDLSIKILLSGILIYYFLCTLSLIK